MPAPCAGGAPPAAPPQRPAAESPGAREAGVTQPLGKFRIGRQRIAAGDPVSARRQVECCRRADANPTLQFKAGVAPLVSRRINLAHARIEQAQHAGFAHRCRHRFKPADRHHRQFGADRQPLGHAARHAQAGEGTRSGAEGNRIELREADSIVGHQLAHQRQQRFRMRATGRADSLVDHAVLPQRASTEIGGCFDGQYLHPRHFTGAPPAPLSANPPRDPRPPSSPPCGGPWPRISSRIRCRSSCGICCTRSRRSSRIRCRSSCGACRHCSRIS